jgi:hypothetical protein
VFKNRYKQFAGILFAYIWYVSESSKTCGYVLTRKQGLDIAKKQGWTRTHSWRKNEYWRVPTASAELLKLLAPYKVESSDWQKVIRHGTRQQNMKLLG